VRYPGPNVGTYVGSIDLSPEQQNMRPVVAGFVAGYAPASGKEPGYLVFASNEQADTLMVQVLDPSEMRLKGNAVPVARNVHAYDASPSGILAYASATQTQLTWCDRQGKVVSSLGEPGSTGGFAISPDGSAIALSRREVGNDLPDLWIYKAATGTPTRLTFDGKSNIDPVWSPDGSKIAFASGREGAVTVYEKAVNGVGQVEALDEQLANFRIPTDWSDHGRYLIEVAIVDAKSKYSVWVLPLGAEAGGSRKSFPYLIGGFNYGAAKLSPNGKWLAYDSDETGRYEVYVQTFPKPGGKWEVSTQGGEYPVWSHDGDELYFLGADGRLMVATVKTGADGSFEATAPKALFQTHTEERPFAVSKDGHFLIATPVSQSGAPISVIVNWPSLLKK
jgi:eukaryotic-like serine/threonine-protein kinase